MKSERLGASRRPLRTLLRTERSGAGWVSGATPEGVGESALDVGMLELELIG